MFDELTTGEKWALIRHLSKNLAEMGPGPFATRDDYLEFAARIIALINSMPDDQFAKA